MAESPSASSIAGARPDHAAQRDWQAAWRRLDGTPVDPAIIAGAALLELRMALALGEPDRAPQIIERLEPEPARHAVLAALDLAAPRGAVRAFSDGGQPLRDVLIRYAAHVGHHRGFVADILAATAPDGSMLPEPLTPRERQLLSELPAMQTDTQIAENLTVSISTVKTHLRAVYRKLGVNCCRDAVTTARRHGLLWHPPVNPPRSARSPQRDASRRRSTGLSP